MERGEPPPAEKVKFLRSEGKTYREIAEMYGISIGLAYELGHVDDEDMIDLRDDVTHPATMSQ